MKRAFRLPILGNSKCADEAIEQEDAEPAESARMADITGNATRPFEGFRAVYNCSQSAGLLAFFPLR